MYFSWQPPSYTNCNYAIGRGITITHTSAIAGTFYKALVQAYIYAIAITGSTTFPDAVAIAKAMSQTKTETFAVTSKAPAVTANRAASFAYTITCSAKPAIAVTGASTLTTVGSGTVSNKKGITHTGKIRYTENFFHAHCFTITRALGNGYFTGLFYGLTINKRNFKRCPCTNCYGCRSHCH